MIKIENVDACGWEAAIRGMRNPLNSWSKSDSYQSDFIYDGKYGFCVGPNDLALMKNLVKAGSDHSKFMRMINVTVDITAPLYWWKEADTYKVGTVRNSCSTMHKIAEKEFTLDDFSRDHLFYEDNVPYAWDTITIHVLQKIVDVLNEFRLKYLKLKNKPKKSEYEQNLMKCYWWQMIQLLPSSYNQRATVQLNYQVLRNMYHSRKTHKLDEWVKFCNFIRTLPYSELITEPISGLSNNGGEGDSNGMG